jgi:hypothetical protein
MQPPSQPKRGVVVDVLREGIEWVLVALHANRPLAFVARKLEGALAFVNSLTLINKS